MEKSKNKGQTRIARGPKNGRVTRTLEVARAARNLNVINNAGGEGEAVIHL